MPNLLSGDTTVLTRGCRVEEVINQPGLRFSSNNCVPYSDPSDFSALRACDLALHSVAESGQKVTDQVNERLEKATRKLCRYFVRWYGR